MMTKEECVKAYETLCDVLVETDYLDGRAISKYPIYEDELETFCLLIEEHFNPKPYKL